jgi:asparagine synthase (glutamine-hydrolysing)
MIFDGWLYERPELRTRLAVSLSADASDAELALEGYLQLGEAVLTQVKGAFSFCLWDGRTETLMCGRDKVGVSPLFYARADADWLFSTSVETLLADPRVSRSINRGALVAYLHQRFRDVEETFFADVQRVPPGHSFTLSREASVPIIRRYWDPLPDGEVSWLSENQVDRFEEVMKQAIGRCLELGKAGIYLSGGLDSGTIAALGTEYCRENGHPHLHAVSLVYDDEANEEQAQRAIAEALRMTQTMIPYEQEEASDVVREALDLNRSWPHPLVTASTPLHLLLGGHAKRQGCDLVLSGEGGDEWLGIHHELASEWIRTRRVRNLVQLWKTEHATSRRSWRATSNRVLWSHGLRPLLVRGGSSLVRRMVPGAVESRRQRLLEHAIPPWLAPDPELRRDIYERAQRADGRAEAYAYRRDMIDILDHPLTVLYKEDAFESSRRVGVPFLEPFYDPQVVEFLALMPPWLRSRGGRYKGMLRTLLHRRFPELGYDTQEKSYLTSLSTSNLYEKVGDLQKSRGLEALTALGVVDDERVHTRLTELLERRSVIDYKAVWMLLCADAWARSRLAPDTSARSLSSRRG